MGMTLARSRADGSLRVLRTHRSMRCSARSRTPARWETRNDHPSGCGWSTRTWRFADHPSVVVEQLRIRCSAPNCVSILLVDRPDADILVVPREGPPTQKTVRTSIGYESQPVTLEDRKDAYIVKLYCPAHGGPPMVRV